MPPKVYFGFVRAKSNCGQTKYAVAGQKATDVATQAAPRDKLVLLLEQGCALRAAGKIDESNKALDEADRLERSQ